LAARVVTHITFSQAPMLTRTTAVLIVGLAVVSATACADTTDPLKPESAPLAAKKAALTHPAGVLSQTVPLGGTWGIALSSTGIVLAAQPSVNTIGGFSLSDPSTLRPTLPVDGWPPDLIRNPTARLAA